MTPGEILVRELSGGPITVGEFEKSITKFFSDKGIQVEIAKNKEATLADQHGDAFCEVVDE